MPSHKLRESTKLSSVSEIEFKLSCIFCRNSGPGATIVEGPLFFQLLLKGATIVGGALLLGGHYC